MLTMKLTETLFILVSLTFSCLADTTFALGPAKVTIPERFTIENKTVSDEGEVSGLLFDSKTGIRIRFRINDFGEPKGLDPAKVEWKKVVHFERPLAGWYDRQLFVFEEDDALRIESRHMFQRSIFQASIPKGQDFHPCLEAMKLIKVRLNQGWKLVRGKSFDDFKVLPTETK
jgi:hypothetical protein